MIRRLIFAVLLVLAALLALNTVVTDNETKDAKADIGRVVDLPTGDIQIREDGDPDRPPIVMLHGFAGSMHWWTPVTQRLARDFHLIRVDLLGHGGSEKPDDGYSMENQARLVKDALADVGVERATVVGHSMGGTVSTALAELDPNLVERVVIVASPPRNDDAELPFLARLGFVPVIGEAIRRVVSDGMVRDNLEDAFAPGFDVPDQFVEDFRRMTYTSYDSSHDASDDYSSDRGLAARLTSARKPPLVIYGAEDEIVEPDSASRWQEVEGSSVITLPDTGHSPHVEQPARVASLIRTFARPSANAGAR